MDFFYWTMIGVLAGLLAKMQFPTERDQNIVLLMFVGVLGAVVSGFAVHNLSRSGLLSMSWVSHIAAFMGAFLLLLLQRTATGQRSA